MDCLYCGGPLIKKAFGPKPKYCSTKCRVAASNLRARGDGRYERWLQQRGELRATERQRAAKRCPYCDQVMLNLKRVQCGATECRRKYQAERMRMKYGHRRRAALRGTAIEMFDSREIYERDGWRCGICKRKVSRTLRYPHPRSASLDHIIPISGGGGHVRENVQCSHLECNLRKQHRGPGQLLLIG